MRFGLYVCERGDEETTDLDSALLGVRYLDSVMARTATLTGRGMRL